MGPISRPDSNKMFKPGYKSLQKHTGQVVFESKREKQIEVKRLGKEDHSQSKQIKSNSFTVSLWNKRKEVLYPISFEMKAKYLN